MTREFEHYPGCRHRDPDNCSACALTDERQDAPNYSAWPLAYMENHRTVPAKWRAAFIAEMRRTDNVAYAENVQKTYVRLGVTFSDGYGLAGPAPAGVTVVGLDDPKNLHESIAAALGEKP